MFLNMVDTLEGGGSLPNSQSRARPTIRCFEKRQSIPCLNDSTSVAGRRSHAIVKAIEDNMLADLSERDRIALARMLKSCVYHLGARSEASTWG
jgi:hypothetical protein